jgi:hypothetical protein
MSGWNTVAFGEAKSDRLELTISRELEYPVAASKRIGPGGRDQVCHGPG